MKYNALVSDNGWLKKMGWYFLPATQMGLKKVSPPYEFNLLIHRDADVPQQESNRCDSKSKHQDN